MDLPRHRDPVGLLPSGSSAARAFAPWRATDVSYPPLTVMPRFLSVRIVRPTFRLAAGIVVTFFALGFVGAFAIHEVETQTAVSDARAAAQELAAKRAALEVELTQADTAMTAAQNVVAEEQVAVAAQALSRATQSATEAAEDSGVSLPANPQDPNAATQVDNLVASPGFGVKAEPTPHEVTNASTDDARVSQPRAQEPPPSAQGREIDDHVMDDAEVVRVLAGETDSAGEARQAAQRLEEAAEVLDDAAKAVGEGSEALSAAALEAAHSDVLVTLDAEMSLATAEVEQSRQIFEAVTDQVRHDEPLDRARVALADLESAAATAELVDRADPLPVVRLRDRIASARDDLMSAMQGVRVTHETWVRSANRQIDARNQERLADHEVETAIARESHTEAIHAAAAARPHGWSGRPVGVSGTNGQLRAESLCQVDFVPGHRLQCDAAQALEEANAEYLAQTGRQLKVTDSYRSFGLQVRTRALKPATAAKPGTSNHGWGMAVDLDPQSSAWLTANGKDYGWVHPSWARPGGPKPESWHLEFVATDVGAFEPPAAPALEERITSAFTPALDSDR